jgi:PAS domain S-box-containing protein
LWIGDRQRWFATTVSPMLEDTVVAVARDITQRKKNEEELKESEERFKRLAEATFEGVAITQDGKIVETNATFAAMFGYEPWEVIGMTPLDVTAPESHEAVRNARTSRFEEPYEVVNLRKDGTTFDAEIRGKASSHEGHSVRVTAIRDITERKKSEEVLRESEERFRSAFESAAIGMALVSPDGRCLRVNRPLCDILGYSERELLELTFQDITYSDDLDDNLQRTERILRGEIHAFQMEKRYIHKDGHIVWALLSVSVLRDEKGDPLYFISQIQDITGRKRAEEALKQSERLYRTVIEQAAENICLVDAETKRVLESNPAFQEALGYTEEELRRMTLYDIVAHDRENIDENVRRVME